MTSVTYSSIKRGNIYFCYWSSRPKVYRPVKILKINKFRNWIAYNYYDLRVKVLFLDDNTTSETFVSTLRQLINKPEYLK